MVCLLFPLAILAGCGGPAAPTEDTTPKVTLAYQRVLQASETGKLESPETLPPEIAALRDDGVPNVDAMEKKAKELAAAKTPAAVKAKANELLAIFPP